MLDGTWQKLVKGACEGELRALAKLISRVESREPGWQQAMKALYPHTGNARILGITGSPGAGKSSAIPPELGNLSGLSRLYLKDNQLTGVLPPELGNLSGLGHAYLQGNALEGPVPSELANLNELDHHNTDLRWNRLWTDDASLRSFLNSKQVGGDWESTQTIAPANVDASVAGPPAEGSVTIGWTHIPYTADPGGYQVYYATAAGGPYSYFGTADDKSEESLTVTGLTQGETYYFVVRTRTEAHANNSNTLLSPPSAEVSFGLGVPFPCNGEALFGHQPSTQLAWLDQTAWPLDLLPIGGAAGFQVNNLGFNRVDGLLYGFRITDPAEIVALDRNGTVFGLDLPAGLPQYVLNAGDVSRDGTTFYLNRLGESPLYIVSLPELEVTEVPITGDTGEVADWAVHPVDGHLYGCDSDDGELAVLDPATGARNDKPVVGGVAPDDRGYGGAWFDAAGRFFAYHNDGSLSMIDDPAGTPTLVDTRSGPVLYNSDAAACAQKVLGAALEMTATADGLPDTVTLDYVFENLSPTEDLWDLSADEDLAAVFGAHGDDWLIGEVTSVPASFANPFFDGYSDTELINQAPAQDLPAGSLAMVTVELQLLTHIQLPPDGEFCNQVEARGKTTGGILLGDLSTQGLDPDPDGDGVPDERDPACFGTSVPFSCTGDAFMVQERQAELVRFDQWGPPPGFEPIGDANAFQINNLGFHGPEGMLYGFRITSPSEIVRIDREGTVFGLGLPQGLPAGVLNAGDVSTDGTTLYLNKSGESPLYALTLPAGPVQQVPVTGDTGVVADWAYHPGDGRLYGGDRTDGELAILDPATGLRTDVAVGGGGLPPSSLGYGGAWFDAAGQLFLYLNHGTLYEIADAAGLPVVVDVSAGGPASRNNDGAACREACLDNGDCAAGDYCRERTGVCEGPGLCAPRPAICPAVVDPVCGCDAVTYGNSCEAAMAGVNVASAGECAGG